MNEPLTTALLFRPAGSRLLLRRMEREKTPGGIILANDSQGRESARFLVLAAGPGDRMHDGGLDPAPAREGETVIVVANCGWEVLIDGEKLLIVGRDHVLGVVDA